MVCNSRKNALLKKRGNKSDRIGARKLAELSHLNQLKPVYHGETEVQMFQSLPKNLAGSTGIRLLEARLLWCKPKH